MPHRYDKYMKDFVNAVQQEQDRLSQLPELPADTQYEIVLDADATEEEVEYYLHNPDAD